MSIKKAYFHLRDEYAAQTGYGRVELHTIMKNKILPLLEEEEDCWIIPDYTTTKNLTDKGWDLFFEHFKIIVNDLH